MYTLLYNSPIGPLWLTSDGAALTGLYMQDPGGLPPADPVVALDTACSWLDAYFQGLQPPINTLPLSPAGTEFQQLVWKLLPIIPYGETRSYGQIAQEVALRMGRERMSPQAVGGAIGRNPIAIIIPCHRVVGANSAMTGYAWGISKKEWLLRHEEDTK